MDEPEADSGYVQYDRALVSPGTVCQEPSYNYRLRMHGASRKGQIYGGDRDANSGMRQLVMVGGSKVRGHDTEDEKIQYECDQDTHSHMYLKLLKRTP
jgi:hypothetical protein